MFKVILYYKYVYIADPAALVIQQRQLCERLGLKGRILIAEEGINGTLEGTTEAIEEYCQDFNNNSLFGGVLIKKSDGTGSAFPKLVVRQRREIVASDLGSDVDPLKRTGTYLTVEELHAWFGSDREFYVVDMRNDYETRSGHFENSILSGIENFRRLPEVLKSLEPLRDKTIVTVCTGGVRCEKASAFLIENGFSDVYQLKDGIVTYMEKYPNRHFKGKLYVFDQRVLIGFNTEDASHEIIGKCYLCNGFSERYVNCDYPECHLHFICCENCMVGEQSFCKTECRESMSVVV